MQTVAGHLNYSENVCKKLTFSKPVHFASNRVTVRSLIQWTISQNHTLGLQSAQLKDLCYKETISQNRTHGLQSDQQANLSLQEIIYKLFPIASNRADSQMSRVVRKPAFCICENKDADQLRGNCEADQRLCFRYIDSTIPLLPKSEMSSL